VFRDETRNPNRDLRVKLTLTPVLQFYDPSFTVKKQLVEIRG
jgi:hypothetical protein